MAYLQQFTFSLRLKSGTHNKVADGLNRRVNLLLEIKASVGGFDECRTYAVDPYFSKIFMALQRGIRVAHPSYTLKDGFLFKGLKLCVPSCSLRKQSLAE